MQDVCFVLKLPEEGRYIRRVRWGHAPRPGHTPICLLQDVLHASVTQTDGNTVIFDLTHLEGPFLRQVITALEEHEDWEKSSKH